MAPVTLPESLALQSSIRDALVGSSLNLSPSSQAIPTLLSRTLVERQEAQPTQPIVVPATYPGITPGANGGEIAGITLGVVFGVILVVWLISSLLNTNRTPVLETSSETDGGARSRHGRSKTNRTKSTRRTRSRSVVSRSEMSEALPLPPQPRPPRNSRRPRETVIIEETRRDASRAREMSRPRVVQEEDDIIEVIEEHSPVRRPRRMSGYRNVDPDEYAGGPRSIRHVGGRR